MNWWVIAGTGSLGIVIGWLVFVFIQRSTTLQIKAFSTLASIVAGGAALTVWRFATDKPLPNEANSYFVGVFVAVLVLGLLNYDPVDP